MEKMEILRRVLGSEQLLDELLEALSNSELEENAEWIARHWGVDFEEEEE